MRRENSERDLILYIPPYGLLMFTTIGPTHNYITYYDYGILEVKT